MILIVFAKIIGFLLKGFQKDKHIRISNKIYKILKEDYQNVIVHFLAYIVKN